jgi:parallel beta-helix repeat protein
VPTGHGGAITYITGNTFDDTGAQGVQLENADTDGIIIQDNDLKNQPQSGVLISGASGTNRIQILDNTFTDNDQAGITLINASSITIDGNRFIAGPGAITQGIGVDFQGPYGANDTVTVTNNYISTNSDGGIAIYHDIASGARNNNITIDGNSIINSQYWGIWIDDHSDGLTTDVALGTNCFSNNDDGNITDSRGILSDVSSSASCPDPTANEPATTATKGKIIFKGGVKIK